MREPEPVKWTVPWVPIPHAHPVHATPAVDTSTSPIYLLHHFLRGVDDLGLIRCSKGWEVNWTRPVERMVAIAALEALLANAWKGCPRDAAMYLLWGGALPCAESLDELYRNWHGTSQGVGECFADALGWGRNYGSNRHNRGLWLPLTEKAADLLTTYHDVTRGEKGSESRRSVEAKFDQVLINLLNVEKEMEDLPPDMRSRVLGGWEERLVVRDMALERGLMYIVDDVTEHLDRAGKVEELLRGD